MPLLIVLLLLTRPALAVAPGLIGPVQALLQMLPQMLAALAALLGGLLSNTYLRLLARKHWKSLGFLGLLLGAALAALLYSAQDRRAPVLATPTASPAPTNQNWVAFRGTLDGGGSGSLDGQPLRANPSTRWIHTDQDKAQYLSSPVAVNGRCYIGASLFQASNSFGAIECFDTRDGKLCWRALTRHPVFSSPVVADGRLYCGEGLHEDNDCKLYCLDVQTGKQLFAVQTHGHVEAAPTIVGEKLLFSAGGEGFYCVRADNGKLLWRSACGHSDSSAAVAGGRVYLGTAYGDNAVVCLDLESGRQIWSAAQDLPVWGHAALAGETVFVGLGNGTFGASDQHPRGAVVALRGADGERRWRRQLPDSVNTSLLLNQERVLLGCRDGFVYCLSQLDGQILWKAPCGVPVLSSLVLQDQQLLVAGGDGHLHALELETGQELWRYLISDVPCEASPMLNGNHLFLGCGSFLECLGP
ncbi:MAG: PQQ-binding-like beta-propeller repeat protein [Candidatus Eremiobacteraeota bacterium]|nr:PQQ-binding-like beta-propeller repeat protein [Candidatus Eremiobacteraeota bacterium]MCW5868130.1 PQQ-binding-like beta-propeller repeat protein [Candidatus Eremiobacteraeota bacterium]